MTEDVSVVVGLQSCRPPPRANSSPDCSLGALTTPIGSNVLYKGPFAPETTPGGNTTDRQQSFYLQVPSSVQPGRSVIVVSRFALQGSAAVSGCRAVELTGVCVDGCVGIYACYRLHDA